MLRCTSVSATNIRTYSPLASRHAQSDGAAVWGGVDRYCLGERIPPEVTQSLPKARASPPSVGKERAVRDTNTVKSRAAVEVLEVATVEGAERFSRTCRGLKKLFMGSQCACRGGLFPFRCCQLYRGRTGRTRATTSRTRSLLTCTSRILSLSMARRAKPKPEAQGMNAGR